MLHKVRIHMMEKGNYFRITIFHQVSGINFVLSLLLPSLLLPDLNLFPNFVKVRSLLVSFSFQSSKLLMIKRLEGEE